VVAGTFDDRRRARVADCEALPGAAATEELAAGRAVENRVSEQDRIPASSGGGEHHEPAAAHALADVVVRLADELELRAG
jgi:hypothetical protein